MFVLIASSNLGPCAELAPALADFGLDWQIAAAGSGAEAIALAAQRPVDVAVVDLRSPGIDGPALLAAIRKHHPEVVRLLMLDDAQQDAAMGALESAHRFLNKPLRAEELIEAVESVCDLREILDSPQLKALIGSIDELPPAPNLYLKLTRVLNDANAPAGAAASLVAQDPVMALKVLRLCNSAFFSGGRPVSDIRSAVVRLGRENLRRLVLASEVFAGGPADSHIDHEAMQLRALRASQLAARLLGGSSAELAATAALLSDVGMLLPGVAIAKAGDTTPDDRPHYAEAGAYLLGLWGLPMPIVEAVASHHQPGKSRTRGFWVGGAVHVARALVSGEAVDEDYLQSVGLMDRLPGWRKLAADMAADAAATA